MPTNEELQKQLIQDLLVESNEGLDRFDREMLALEKGQATPDTPNVIFRVIHTIKGTAGCLGLSKIESVAHVGENLLSLLREGKVTVTPPLISTLLAYADALRAMLSTLRDAGNEGSEDYSALLKQLQDLQSTPAAAPTETNPAPQGAAPVAAPAALPQGWGLFDDEPAPAALAAMPDPAEVAAPEVARTPVVAPASAQASPPAPAASHPAGEGGSRGSSPADTAIRVNVEQLDKLMNLVGELVLARNQIVQHSALTQDNPLIAASQRLNIITTELQEAS
jgi:two-component system chemotaxis sensor kinase CheA